MSPKVLFYFSNDSAGACGDSPGLLFGKFAVHFPGAGDFAGPDFHPSRTQYFTDRTDGTPALPCEDVERPGRRTGSDDECTFAFLPGLRKAESRFAHENRNEPRRASSAALTYRPSRSESPPRAGRPAGSVRRRHGPHRGAADKRSSRGTAYNPCRGGTPCGKHRSIRCRLRPAARCRQRCGAPGRQLPADGAIR